MNSDAESIVERRRLKRRISIWRIAAVVLAVLFFGTMVMGDSEMSGSGGILPHVARVNIDGVITNDRKIIDLLDRVGKASQVKAVILEINSPGGTTTGGEAMYDAVRRLAEKKPVVATCGTLATSAAYIVALATDRIFVYGNTITGSVGVIFQWANVTELMKTLGIRFEDVKSGSLKAVPNPFEPTTAVLSPRCTARSRSRNSHWPSSHHSIPCRRDTRCCGITTSARSARPNTRGRSGDRGRT